MHSNLHLRLRFGEQVVADTPLRASFCPECLGNHDEEQSPIQPPAKIMSFQNASMTDNILALAFFFILLLLELDILMVHFYIGWILDGAMSHALSIKDPETATEE